MNLGSQRIMKMGCVVREPLHGLAAQLGEAAIFEGEPVGLRLVLLKTLSSTGKKEYV
jgi:hypothetical protein